LSTRNDDPPGASRPFDRGRDGFVMAEGAAVLVLEELEHALARGVEPLAELVGYGATADASHITLPSPGGAGAVRAARRALEKAGATPDEIDHVNAHATSTPEGDRAELQGLQTLLGERGPRVAVTANLDHSDLVELEIQVGATGLTLRKPTALAQPVLAGPGAPAIPAAGGGPGPGSPAGAGVAAPDQAPPARPSVKAPLTGIWYGS